MTTDNMVLIPQPDGIAIFDTNCDKIDSIALDFTPYMISVGPDELLYIFAYNGGETNIVCMDLKGVIQWEKTLNVFRLLQPPIVSAKSMVILVEQLNNNNKIEAFKDNQKLWEYELEGRKAMATVLNDETILVIDGKRLLYLNESGKAIWI